MRSFSVGSALEHDRQTCVSGRSVVLHWSANMTDCQHTRNGPCGKSNQTLKAHCDEGASQAPRQAQH